MCRAAPFPLHRQVRWRWQQLLTAALLLVGASQAKPQLEDDGGYSGIVVAISPDLEESKCGKYIDEIQILMANSSTTLQRATQGSEVFFRNVTIVLPIGWDCPNVSPFPPESDETWATATIRLSNRHPIFRENPWTRQPRGCGQEGDFIYISENFLLYEMADYGSKEKVMVHEWAKYRWGIFEEYGHLFDSLYPPALAVQTSWKPNYCSNVPLIAKPHGLNKDDCEEASECIFDINETDNINVTSSLMALPFLASVESFCTSDVHNEDLPSKQNALCSGQSTWDIIKEHPDIKNSRLDRKEDGSPSFRFVQVRAPATKYAIILQSNKIMKETISRWEFLRDATKQMIRLLLPDEAIVALISFDKEAKLLGKGSLSSNIEREKLANLVPKSASDSTGRNVVKAVEEAAKALQSGAGTIILAVDCLAAYSVQASDIVKAAGDHKVWPVLYPWNDKVSSKPYEDAATGTQGQLCSVKSETLPSGLALLQRTSNYISLSECFQKVLSGVIGQVGVGTCSDENQCTVVIDVNDKWGEKGWISTYRSKSDFLETGEEEEVTGPGIESQTLNILYETYHWTEVESLAAGKWTVNIAPKTLTDVVYVDIIGKIPPPVSSKPSLEIWGSQDLDKLEYSSKDAPILFVSVTDADSHIVLGARVLATIDGNDLRLKDNGLSADVTGNDGIYSAFIFVPSGNITINITADDDEGQAKVVLSTSRAVTNPTYTDPVCCGSFLNISNTVEAAAFSVTKTFGAQILNSAPATLPPSPVRDLQAEAAGGSVNLTFTASGNILDIGTAPKIKVEYWEPGNATRQSKQVNNSVAAGGLTTVVVEPPCNSSLVFTVSPIGVSSEEALPSNRANAFVPCAPPPTKPDGGDENPEGLDAGAVVGIVIGILLLLLLIALIVYLVLNRDHLDELRVWQWLTCKPCREKDLKNRIYKRQNDVIRRKAPPSNPVESVADLYAKPDLDAKRRAREEIGGDDDDDDGGFANSSHHTNNLDEPSPYNDHSSQSSSIPHYQTPANLPINIIGIPESYDNYGYYGGSSTNSLARQEHEQGYNYGVSGNELAYDANNDAYIYDPRANQDYNSAEPVNSNSYYTQPSTYIQPALPRRKPQLKTEV